MNILIRMMMVVVAGKEEYFTDLVSRPEEDHSEPRLFQLSR